MVAPSAHQPELKIVPIEAGTSLRTLAYDALRLAITQMDIYGQIEPIRLDERQLSQKLGVSRTPIREALTLLEQEGFVRAVPRRGIYVVRKSRREICEMIVVAAALESIAARLAAQKATEEQLKKLSERFEKFSNETSSELLNPFSQANLDFHRKIIALGGCELIRKTTENLFAHIRAIRTICVTHEERPGHVVALYKEIVEAISQRDGDKAERLVREYTLDLAAYVEKHGVFAE